MLKRSHLARKRLPGGRKGWWCHHSKAARDGDPASQRWARLRAHACSPRPVSLALPSSSARLRSTCVLSRSLRSRRSPHLASPCIAALRPPLAVLRPPPRASLRRAPTTPRSSACPTGCARAWASRRWPPRPKWSPERRTRRAPPRSASPATNRRSTRVKPH